jgi:hypothetical protein
MSSGRFGLRDAITPGTALDSHRCQLARTSFTPKVIARFIRITSGNLRLLTQLLTQIERVLSVNEAHAVSLEIVEAARDSLVIGQA